MMAANQDHDTLPPSPTSGNVDIPSDHSDDSSGSGSLQKTVFTGEKRVPIRERLRTMRQGIRDRALQRRKSGVIPNALEAITSRTPSPLQVPQTPKLPQLAKFEIECPGAPIKKAKKVADLRGESSESSDSEGSNDVFFDRQANKKDQVASKKLFLDSVNERRRSRNSTPVQPSPLRRSFNAAEMEKLAAGLNFTDADKGAEDKYLKPMPDE
ncbi:hypothetical protein GGR54DRAFT_583339 [Hypoxylon sp. NC1633]|nr:hypothetical protein GGR54DRAFT_583339 [Hypoxylon sp. NC1633]